MKVIRTPNAREIGRRFQEACRVALQVELGRTFESEVQIHLDRGRHHFDLATPERDMFVECKAYTWTKSGNVPSAKLAHVRESVEWLRQLTGTPSRMLILKVDRHAKRDETLGEYFVRLNERLLRSITVFELPEAGGRLVLLSDDRRRSQTSEVEGSIKRGSTKVALGADDLGRMRRSLLERLDRVERRRDRGESIAARVRRLIQAENIPPITGSLMLTLLQIRNSVEYDRVQLSDRESAIVREIWSAILEWSP